MKKAKEEVIQKAAKQVLIEILGFDEGCVYFLLLNKDDLVLKKDFSYSKKYRILKKLFESNGVCKIKEQNKDFYSYFLLPPSFLRFEKVDLNIVEYLEKIYLKNFGNIFYKDFSQIILKDDKTLLIFLLKYYMKDKARLLVDNFDIKNILGNDYDNVSFVKNGKSKRKLGVIDDFAYEFVDVMNQTGFDYIGYLGKNNVKKDYTSAVQDKLDGY
ncbi:MAG: hypothetical protein KKF56_02965 [Nanoarchaeota archaeon]|nr:hypothetical protein [Nanoarchaeota archaeon]